MAPSSTESSLTFSAPDVRVKRVLQAVFLLAMTFQTFGNFPYFGPIGECWNVACSLYFFYVFFFPLPKSTDRTTGLERYMFVLVLLVPLWAGVGAWREFGQPIVYGVLAARNLTVIAGVLFFARALRRGYFTLDEIETALLTLSWATLVLFTWMRVFLDPANFTQYPGLVSVASPDFYLQPYFILYGAVYYGLRGVRFGRLGDYVRAFLFLAGEINSSSRTLMVSLVLSLLFFAWRWAGWRRFLLRVPAALALLGILAGSAYVVIPNQTAQRLGQFSDAFNVLLGKQVQDSSAQWHYVEIFMALSAIGNHPIVGNGRLSNQWEGGAEEVRGEHFFPEDVGILGALYQYGFLGLAFFGVQYWVAVSWSRRLRSAHASPLLDAAKGFLLLTAVMSFIGSGLAIFVPQITLFFVVILRGFGEENYPRCAKAESWLGLFIVPDRAALGQALSR